MKQFIVLALLSINLCARVAGQSTPPSSSHNKTIGVETNKNVELLGFAYFMAYLGKEAVASDEGFNYNGKPLKWREWYQYGVTLYKKYQPFENSKNLAVMARQAENIWLDYLINLLVQVEDFPRATLPEGLDSKYYLRFSSKGDIDEAKRNATAFLNALNLFYAEVNFDEYLSKYSRYYRMSIEEVKSGLPSDTFIPTMEAFYRQQFQSYTLVPSLALPSGMGFGVNYSRDQQTRIYNVFGAQKLQEWADSSKPVLGFEDPNRIRELSTHEFGHSFVNPAVDKVPASLITATDTLFAPIRSAMADQGYTSWKACLYEHFVRAGEVMIARKLGAAADAERLQKHYISERQFRYLPIIIAELEKYQQDPKDTYEQAVLRAVEQLSKSY